MTDRRRNAFILLLVAGLLIASVVAIVRQDTRLGLDLKGGVELVYEAKPTKQSEVTNEAVERSIDIMRERVDQLGVAEPEIQRSGQTQISVALPDVTNAEEAVRQVGTTARLYFYDWEPNVLGPNGRPAPDDPAITGGETAGGVGPACMPKYDALARARRVDAKPNQNTTTNGPSYYVVDDRQRQVLAGPAETREDVVSILDGERLGADDRVVEIKEGTTLVQAEPPAPRDGEEADEGAGPDCWFVINDNFSLQGEDIRNPEQQFDQGPGGQGAPNVTFEFSEEGRRIWQEVTRSIAERGLETTRNQHFAIVLDNQLISTPFIDFRQNPTASTPPTARRSPAASRSSPPSGWPTCSRRARCPSTSSSSPSRRSPPRSARRRWTRGSSRPAVGFAIVAGLPAVLLPRPGAHRGRRPRGLRDLLLRPRPDDPHRPDPAGHRRPRAHDRRHRRREHRHLRARQGGDPQRALGAGGHRAGLQEGHHGDHRRERRDVHDGVHPLHPRHRGGQGLRLRPGHRHARHRLHRGPHDPGRSWGRWAARGSSRIPACSARRRRSASSTSTSSATRSTSSPRRA
jgi:protein-export membrane protein SecD